MRKYIASAIIVSVFLASVCSGMALAESSRSSDGKSETVFPNDIQGNPIESSITEDVYSYLKKAPKDYVQVYNVLKFGAAGDGRRNDTAAIQKALDQARGAGGGTVYLPEGTYKTSADLNVYSNTKILGNQAKISKVNVADSYAVLTVAKGQSNVVIEGLWLENNKASGCIGVDLQTNATDVWIQDNRFTGKNVQAVNINSTGVKHVQVSGNHFEQVNYGVLTNLMAKDVRDVRIVNNQFIHIYSDAIELNHPGNAYESGENFVIAGNYMLVPPGFGSSGSGGFGIGIAGATHVAIIGNVIENARYEAIHIEDEAKHISIVGNVINGVANSPDLNLNSGIYVIDGDYMTISGNSIRNADDFGIHLEYATGNQATRTVVTGNTITGSKKGGGIRIAGHTGYADIVVTDNIAVSNQGDGIRIGGVVNNLKIANNISRENTGYGLFLEKPGLGWYISGNSLFDNGSGDIGYGTEYKIPVPLRNNGAIVTSDVTVSPGDDSSKYSPWKDAFSLGTGAEGVLYVTAKMGEARSTKIFKVSWDGKTLETTQAAHDIDGALEAVAPRMNGNKLQVQAYSLNSGAITFDVQFEGLILLK